VLLLYDWQLPVLLFDRSNSLGALQSASDASSSDLPLWAGLLGIATAMLACCVFLAQVAGW